MVELKKFRLGLEFLILSECLLLTCHSINWLLQHDLPVNSPHWLYPWFEHFLSVPVLGQLRVILPTAPTGKRPVFEGSFRKGF